MIERRQYERLSFPFPLRLETITTNGKQVLDLTTKDISASGTFVPTLTSFPEGTQFILDLTFPDNNNQTLKNLNRFKDYKGNLVRSTFEGIAIQFDRDCQMECLKVL